MKTYKYMKRNKHSLLKLIFLSCSLFMLAIAFKACDKENLDNSKFPKLTGQFIYMDNTYELDHGIMYRGSGHTGAHAIYLFSEDGRNKVDLSFIVQSWPTETGPPVASDRLLPGWYQFMGETGQTVGDRMNAKLCLAYRCDFSERFEDSYPHYGVEIEKEEDGNGYYLRIFTQNEPGSPQIDRVVCRGQFALSTKPR